MAKDLRVRIPSTLLFAADPEHFYYFEFVTLSRRGKKRKSFSVSRHGDDVIHKPKLRNRSHVFHSVRRKNRVDYFFFKRWKKKTFKIKVDSIIIFFFSFKKIVMQRQSNFYFNRFDDDEYVYYIVYNAGDL